MGLREALDAMEKAGNYMNEEKAAKLLHLSTEEVGMLHAQGRLEAEERNGECHYYAPSVFSHRVETLMRRKLAGLKESEVRMILEEVAALQYELGHTRGIKEATRELGGAVLQTVPEEAGEERKAG